METDLIDEILTRLDALANGALQGAEALFRLTTQRVFISALVAVSIGSIFLIVGFVSVVASRRSFNKDNLDMSIGLGIGGFLALSVGLITVSVNLSRLLAPKAYAVQEIIRDLIPG